MSSYYVKSADFVACHNPSYIGRYDIVSEVREGGTFLLNCPWSREEMEKHLPAKVKRTIAQRHIRFFTIDALGIARELGLGGHFNMVLQAAFFHLMPVIPEEDAVRFIKAAAEKTYFAKGEDVVRRNLAAIDAGISSAREVPVPESWLTVEDEPLPERDVPEVVTGILEPLNA